MKNYPILLNQVRFVGLGYDKTSFDGSVVYIRQLPIVGVRVVPMNDGFKDLIDALIEDYVIKNLSGFENVETFFTSAIVFSEEELNKKIKLLGQEYGYDKTNFQFNIIPNVNYIVANPVTKAPDFTNVEIRNLTAYTRSISNEMRDSLKCSFLNLAHPYSNARDWSDKHPVLSQLASTIMSLN